MKKNIAIAVLALLCIAFFFYGLIQKLEAKKQAEIAIEQTKAATECRNQAKMEMKRAQEALQLAQMIAEEARYRAEKLENEKRKK